MFFKINFCKIELILLLIIELLTLPSFTLILKMPIISHSSHSMINKGVFTIPNHNYNSTTTSDNYTGAGIVLGTTLGLVMLFIVLVCIINNVCMKPQKKTIALPMDTKTSQV
jgi:hypothetical protein